MLKYVIKNVSDITDETYKQSFECMNAERQAKVKRFKNTIQKKCTLAGEWLAREMLAEITGEKPESFVILADEKGKLYCDNFSQIHFNISHSDDLVAVAVCDKPVGIDIESVRKVSLKLSKRVCTQKELEYIFEKLPDGDDYLSQNPEYIKRFFEIWTIKEAYFKCIGTGITDFQTVDALSDKFKKIKIENDNYIMHIVTK